MFADILVFLLRKSVNYNADPFSRWNINSRNVKLLSHQKWVSCVINMTKLKYHKAGIMLHLTETEFYILVWSTFLENAIMIWKYD